MRTYIRNIYKKIIEQSKKKFFFDVFFVPQKPETKIEIFQLNLIIVLWYMKKKKFFVVCVCGWCVCMWNK